MRTIELLNDALMSSNPIEELEKLLKANMLTTIPELTAIVNFGGDNSGHKNLWHHTKQVVSQVIPVLHLRWAALFHDVGKVRAFSIKHGKIAFHNHEEMSRKLFLQVARRLGFEIEMQNKIAFLIANLGAVESYESDWTDSAVRRLYHKITPTYFQDILALSRADITTKNSAKKYKLLLKINELRDRSLAIVEADAIVPPLPSGIGEELMRTFALPPSRKIGEIKRLLEDAISKKEIPSHQEANFYITFLQNNLTRFGLVENEVQENHSSPSVD